MGKHNKDKQIFLNKDKIVPTKNKNSLRRKKAVITIGTYSNFLSEAELVNNIIKDEMSRLNFKPVLEVDPKSIIITNAKMQDHEKAFMLAKKYRYEDDSMILKNIFLRNMKKAMGKKEVELVLDIVSKIKATKLV